MTLDTLDTVMIWFMIAWLFIFLAYNIKRIIDDYKLPKEKRYY